MRVIKMISAFLVGSILVVLMLLLKVLATLLLAIFMPLVLMRRALSALLDVGEIIYDIIFKFRLGLSINELHYQVENFGKLPLLKSALGKAAVLAAVLGIGDSIVVLWPFDDSVGYLAASMAGAFLGIATLSYLFYKGYLWFLYFVAIGYFLEFVFQVIALSVLLIAWVGGDHLQGLIKSLFDSSAIFRFLMYPPTISIVSAYVMAILSYRALQVVKERRVIG